jgi:hypothetical protein
MLANDIGFNRAFKGLSWHTDFFKTVELTIPETAK